MWDATEKKMRARTQQNATVLWQNTMTILYILAPFLFRTRFHISSKRKRLKDTGIINIHSELFLNKKSEPKNNRRENTTNQTKAETKLPILCRTTHQFNRWYDFGWSLHALHNSSYFFSEFIFELWHFIVNIWLSVVPQRFSISLIFSRAEQTEACQRAEAAAAHISWLWLWMRLKISRGKNERIPLIS